MQEAVRFLLPPVLQVLASVNDVKGKDGPPLPTPPVKSC